MKRIFLPALLLTLGLTASLTAGLARAEARFSGPDFSGTYDCTGIDRNEGKYIGVVTLALVPEQSTGDYGAYTFKLDVPDYGSYPGHAAAHGKDMAIYFAHTDAATRDYGTGIARFSYKGRKWSFFKYYFEPEYKGGNYGKEKCVQR